MYRVFQNEVYELQLLFGTEGGGGLNGVASPCEQRTHTLHYSASD